jgi:hypothetical protein
MGVVGKESRDCVLECSLRPDRNVMDRIPNQWNQGGLGAWGMVSRTKSDTSPQNQGSVLSFVREECSLRQFGGNLLRSRHISSAKAPFGRWQTRCAYRDSALMRTPWLLNARALSRVPSRSFPDGLRRRFSYTFGSVPAVSIINPLHSPVFIPGGKFPSSAGSGRPVSTFSLRNGAPLGSFRANSDPARVRRRVR